jgi:ABC-type uncharacterized transport system YnjBCD substrate-binding protein
MAGLLSKAEFDTLSGKQAAITAASTVNAGTVTTAQQNGVELKPFDTGAGQTGELRFDELAANGSNYVALKAADSLAGNVVWTLPPSDGASGELLSTGSNEITNGTIADADVSGTAAIATSKLSGAITSISGHGLGSRSR